MVKFTLNRVKFSVKSGQKR